MPNATTNADLTIPDLTDPRTFVEDVPHAVFAEMRRRPGLHWQPTTVSSANGGFWAVTRFEDIVAIEKDPETFSSVKGAAYPVMNLPPDNPMRDMLMHTDPPTHSRLRRAAARGFGPRVVANFEPWVREIIVETIESLRQKEEFDYVEEVARTVPALVVARVLGVPREDREKLVDWATRIFAANQDVDGLGEGEGTMDKQVPTLMEILAYSEWLQKDKLANPADDMFTELGRCVERGEINQSEFLMWVFIMMTAGYETTHTAIGQSMRMYLENPKVAEATDRAIAEGTTERAIDEYLRLISPPMEMARTATRDVEFAGEQIKKDDVLVMYFVAANRDAAVFSDPDTFNPWRTETATLAFGSGVHRCIGAYLAKLELKILFEELHSRGINLRLNGQPQRGWSIFINQLQELPVAHS